ncbi:hypothetical protein GGX14DRAFT_674018 [Mycena pura]|uniref:Uncharacterized protein n=1 Tax=Mycena pura TaxID=153505 RepID=A0AAD6UVW8_9AGAR|nr:hypothetical protein GGX14DRAFT_674018 [Mycena pura]
MHAEFLGDGTGRAAGELKTRRRPAADGGVDALELLGSESQTSEMHKGDPRERPSHCSVAIAFDMLAPEVQQGSPESTGVQSTGPGPGLNLKQVKCNPYFKKQEDERMRIVHPRSLNIFRDGVEARSRERAQPNLYKSYQRTRPEATQAGSSNQSYRSNGDSHLEANIFSRSNGSKYMWFCHSHSTSTVFYHVVQEWELRERDWKGTSGMV